MGRGTNLAEDAALVRAPSFELLEPLGAGAHSVVYRARRGGIDVAVKIAHEADSARRSKAARDLFGEAAALARVRHRAIVQVIEAGLDPEGRPFLVLEHVSGESLAERLSRGALSVDDTVALMKQLAGALCAVHQKRLVHRDVKPGNILLDQAGNAHLIDFGLAGRERDQAQATAIGTFLYAAPEQSGALKIGVDGRADLYALGVVAFECLTGEPPFVAADVQTLVHMHANQRPRALKTIRSEVSDTLSAVIDRLLAKDPDDRYQTAESLVHDLERLSTLTSDKLGREHADRDLEALLPLVGRAEAMGKLLSRVSAASRGQGSVSLVVGPSGVGKTRVAQEIARRAVLAHGLCLRSVRSSADAAPLAAFRALVDRLVERLRRLPEHEAAPLRLAIQKAAGEYAPFLAQTFVLLRPILGKASARFEGAGAEIVYDAIACFFVELSKQLPLLLLTIDDAHGLDSGSWKVLRRLAYRSGDSRLAVVLVARSQDASTLESLSREVDERLDLVVDLGPLDEAAASELASAYLSTGRLDSDVLEHFAARSHGNPRLLVEYLEALLTSGTLRPRDGGFVLDRAALRTLSLPEDASQIVIERLAQVDAEVALLLARAAVLGTVIEVDELCALVQRERSELAARIEAAEAAHVLERVSPTEVAFADERCRALLLERLDRDERCALHRRAAALIQRRTDDVDACFRLAMHSFEGLSRETAQTAFEANLRAGNLALERRAAREALHYLTQAREAAEQYELPSTAELADALAQAFTQVGQVDRAFEWYGHAIERASEPVHKAELNVRAAELHMTANLDTQNMAGHLFAAWEHLGLRMPQNRPTGALLFVFWALFATFVDLTGIGFGSARDVRRKKLEYRLFENTLKWAYLSNKLFILLALNFRLLYAGLVVGPSRELVYAYATHGATLGNLGLPERWSNRYDKKAKDIARALDDRHALIRAEYWYTVGLAQRGRIVEHAKALDELLIKHGQWFDVPDLFFAYMDLSVSYSLRGYSDRMSQVMRRCVEEISAKAGAETTEAKATREMLASTDALFMRPAQAATLIEERTRADLDPDKDSFMWFQAWSLQAGFRLETLDYDMLDEAIANADRAGRDPMTAGWQFSQYWMTKGYARLTQCFLASRDELPKRMAQLRDAIHELRYAAKIGVYRLHRSILQAGLAHLEGKHERALHLLAEAEALAQTHDSAQGMYDLLRLRARIHGALGRESTMRRDATLAHTICDEMKWLHRARVLRKTFGLDQALARGPVHLSSSASVSVASLQHTGVAAASADALQLRRDRDALLEVSLAASRVFDPVQQAGVTLDKLLAILGGERAFFLSWNEESEELELTAARNAKGEALPSDAEYPRSVLEWVRVMRAPIVVNGAEEARQLGSDTLVRLNLRSVIAAPLMLRERFVGVVYLDSAIAKGVFTEADVDILKAIANQIAVSQETAKSAQREIERRALEKDLQLSGAVQSLLLPKQDLIRSDQIEAVGVFEPASRVGGDFWYADTARNGRMRIIVGDVTGHGAGSAMVTAVMAGCYRALRAVAETPDLHAVVALMDRILRETCGGQYTMPLSALDIDVRTGRVDFWSAAAPPLLLRRVTGELETISSKGVPLGSDELVLGHEAFALEPGDRLLAFTDGVTELEMASGNQLGMRRLSRMFAATADLPLVAAREHLVRGLREAAEGIARSDDMTLVLVTRRG